MVRIFTFPYNYEAGSVAYEADAQWMQGDLAPELSDGRTDTFNSNTHYIIDFDGTSDKTINAIFCEVFGFDTVTLSADSQRATNVVDGHSINEADQLRGTRHYAFVPFLGLTANRLRLSFGGTGRVFRVALTRQLLNIANPEWTQISHRRIGDSERRTNVNGMSVVIPGRSGRWKWRTNFTGYFSPDANPTADQLVSTFESNENLFVLPFPLGSTYQAGESRRLEELATYFYPAAVEAANLGIEYIGGLLMQQEVSFTLQEL